MQLVNQKSRAIYDPASKKNYLMFLLLEELFPSKSCQTD